MAGQEKGKDKIGSGHMRAMGKLGLAELRGAFYPGSNVAQPTEYGVFGKETPGEVSQMRDADKARDEEPSILAEKQKAAEAKRDVAAEQTQDKQLERSDR